jgi:predicted flap endonuclease-1-like 5' DNA nuclease
MAELMTDNWTFLVVALLAGVIVAWWIFAANRKATITREERPDDAAGAARRNEALINAPPAAAFPEFPPPTPEGMAGIGEAVRVAADLVPVEPLPPAEGDDLKRIKGVGPKVETILHGLGVTTFAQVAAWDEAEVDRIDARLGAFAGRIRRDDWRAQARLLAAGDTAAYEAKFGKL